MLPDSTLLKKLAAGEVYAAMRLLETGASEISSIFAFWRVRMVSVAFIEIRPSASFHKPESRSRLTTFWWTLASVLFVAGLPTSRDFICDELRITIFTDF